MTKLEKLLYRKSVIESVLPIYQKGAETYKCLVDVLERELPNTTDEVEKSRMAIEILENREKARGFITSFKLNKREYEDYIIPSLQQEREMEEKDGEAYKDRKDPDNDNDGIKDWAEKTCAKIYDHDNDGSSDTKDPDDDNYGFN